MRHLSERQLVGLAVGNGENSGESRHHLAECSECRRKCEELRELTALLRESCAVPPVSAWWKLKRRVTRSLRPDRDWKEPRWAPLVLVHLAAVMLALLIIVRVGGWFESSWLWERLAGNPVVATIGPRGLVGLAFLVGGSLLVLALTPILCWELGSRRSE